MKKNSYEEKIELIFLNSLECNGDNEKAINDVKSWLRCEWQCGMIPDTDDYNSLYNKVDGIAADMLRAM